MVTCTRLETLLKTRLNPKSGWAIPSGLDAHVRECTAGRPTGFEGTTSREERQ